MAPIVHAGRVFDGSGAEHCCRADRAPGDRARLIVSADHPCAEARTSRAILNLCNMGLAPFEVSVTGAAGGERDRRRLMDTGEGGLPPYRPERITKPSGKPEVPSPLPMPNRLEQSRVRLAVVPRRSPPRYLMRPLWPYQAAKAYREFVRIPASRAGPPTRVADR